MTKRMVIRPCEKLTNNSSSFHWHLPPAVLMPRSRRSLRKVRGATRRYRDPRIIGWLWDYKYGRRRPLWWTVVAGSASARTEVLSVFALHPQLVCASLDIILFLVFSFSLSSTKCCLKIRVLSSFTPRYLEMWVPFTIICSLVLASRLLRWKVISVNLQAFKVRCQVLKYFWSFAISLPRVLSTFYLLLS
jgi:hypothetical protein